MNTKKPVKDLKAQLKLAYESNLIETYSVHEDAQIDLFPQEKYESHIVLTFKATTPAQIRSAVVQYIEDTFESVIVSPKGGMQIVWIDYLWTP